MRLTDKTKIDIGLVPQALNNTNATGAYYKLSGYGLVLVLLVVGAMAATKTAIVELLQAKSATGTDAKGIPTTAGQLAKATITANTEVVAGTIDLASVANTDVITINGVSFTKAAATDTTKQEFADAAGLVACINHATYGVPGVTASAASAVVTVTATNPGDTLVTLDKTENAGTVTLATTKAIAYVEVNTDGLDHNNGFIYVAAKVTTTANTVASIATIRGDAEVTPTQVVSASAHY
ncbi:hypothetical protein [Dehalococcoides mccartyi]|jgi:hypothetical protein|uniref:hypothetical protein n=1 Tax=Dehalococcoides mccartyi TaxID=61435 RepID=UPI00098F353D|nr:hypothetical protein [Dehalococcoides mccartyi]AQU06102.1 hypothetical protein B1777_05305 [Dehalococcoides mccartyi]AQU07545.1 hypothetical protein B1778_05105 [Dehalococcoides mccartyi]AQX74791.1 hypothetical protein B1776_04400 [Dehalococcoides mccartyi]AQY73368.1 hypothetical protein B1772_04710 [Dehalococcoides mccartyi]QBX64068.1 hypothetical protein DhcFL2_04735 [Dehalococcoides mccartyi]